MSTLFARVGWRALLIVGVGGVAFAIDRASKALVLILTRQSETFPPPSLWRAELGEFGVAVQLTLNTGVSFGIFRRLGAHSQIPLLLLGLLLCGIVIVAAARARDRLSALGASLVVGGALGNLYDRLFHQGVFDFLDFYAYNYHWYRFNCADIAIFCGIALWLLAILRSPS